ncbi:MAG: methyl-accepting chemotaxis protein, partial [Oxalobacteraceae bacterium]
EEAAAAAASLQDQAGDLLQVVSVFKLDDGMHALTASSPTQFAVHSTLATNEPKANRSRQVQNIINAPTGKADEWEEF